MTTVSQIINDYNAGEIILLHISDYDIFCEACCFLYPYWMEIEVHKQKDSLLCEFLYDRGITKEELSSNFNRMSNKMNFLYYSNQKTYKSRLFHFKDEVLAFQFRLKFA